MGEAPQVRIVSAIPGRVRLKLRRRGGMLEDMQRIAEALSARTEVSNVQVNPQTGSILIHYDPERGSLNDLCSALRPLNVVIDQETRAGMSLSSAGGASQASANLTRMLGELNMRVGRATNELADLRLLVPLGLGAFTVRQIFRHGLKLSDVPWYVAGWYAFQTFTTLNDTTTRPAQAAGRAASIPGVAESGEYDN